VADLDADGFDPPNPLVPVAVVDSKRDPRLPEVFPFLCPVQGIVGQCLF